MILQEQRMYFQSAAWFSADSLETCKLWKRKLFLRFTFITTWCLQYFYIFHFQLQTKRNSLGY